MKTKEISIFLAGELHGNDNVEITNAASLEKASTGEIAFCEKAGDLTATSASCIIVPTDLVSLLPENMAVITVAHPKLAFARIAHVLHPSKKYVPGIHKSSVVAENAMLGGNILIEAFCIIGDGTSVGEGTQVRSGSKIGDNVKIGKNCILHPNVCIEDGCTVGNNVILHAGVVIGADGFGYVRDSEEYVKFPQIGTVVIEDNVEVGANTCIDRGALGETRIGEGTKIDNLVQIAHNVTIGKRVVIAAQTGISGSVVIEDDCVIGGQVGIGDHVRILSGAIIGSQAGVLPGKIVRPGVWWGTPIQPLDEYKRQNAHVKGIESLKAEVKDLKRRIDQSSTDNDVS